MTCQLSFLNHAYDTKCDPFMPNGHSKTLRSAKYRETKTLPSEFRFGHDVGMGTIDLTDFMSYGTFLGLNMKVLTALFLLQLWHAHGLSSTKGAPADGTDAWEIVHGTEGTPTFDRRYEGVSLRFFGCL